MEQFVLSDAPGVSVVIPVYNVESFLRACVDSVLKQTFRNFEIILVDDGATDASPAICDAYAKEFACIRVIHQANGGLSAARNTGFSAARGTFIYFLDSDDWIVPFALQKLYDIATRNSADAVLFEASVVDESGRPIDHPDYNEYYQRKVVYDTCRPGRQLFSELLQNGDYLPAAPLIFMRREAVHTPFAPILHEDELFTPQFLYGIDRACTCGDALYVRRVRKASITSEKKTYRHFCGMAAASHGLMQMQQADAPLKKYAVSLALSAVSIFTHISRADKRKVKEEKLRLKKALLALHTRRGQIAAAFLTMPLLNRLYQAFKRNVPNWLYRLNAYRRDRKRFLPALDKLAASSQSHARILLIGSPEHGNLGDHAITQAELAFFRDHVPEAEVFDIPMAFYRVYRRKIGALARKTDRIAVSGGGWLGNVWYHNEKIVLDIVKRFSDQRIVILPQTIWYRPSRKTARQKKRARRTYFSHQNLTLLVREQESLAVAKTLCADARYCPDMCLYLDDRKPREREGALLCFRQDRERTLEGGVVQQIEDFLLERGCPFRYTTTVLTKPVMGEQAAAALEKKFEEFRGARVVVTDRLHAALFSAVTGTYCIAFDNLTGKVSGVLTQCRGTGAPYLATSAENALNKAKEYLAAEEPAVITAPSFEELIHIWRN